MRGRGMEEMNTPALETERLALRKFRREDVDALYALYSDREVNRFLPWFPPASPTSPPPTM